MSFYTWPPVQLSVSAPAGLLAFEGGDDIDTTSLGAAYVTARTLAQDIKKIRFVNNSGNTFIVGINTVDTATLAPGEKATFDFSALLGDDIDIKTDAGAGAAGNLYLNYFG